MGTKIYLNLYDLSPANDYLYPIGLGLHHSGVEILGTEYSFASNAGIFESTPKEAPGAKFREQILMGVLDGGQTEVKKAVEDLRVEFGPNDYNIIRKNCNHFANRLVYRLLGTKAPGYINRIADVGVCCDCLLPRQLLENAPVGDPDANSNNGGGGFGSNSGIVAMGRGPSAPQSNSMRAFEGAGSRLGGGDSSSSAPNSGGLLGSLLPTKASGSSGGNTKGTDDLTDRRDRARKAALARLEKQNQHSQGGVSSEQKDK